MDSRGGRDVSRDGGILNSQSSSRTAVTFYRTTPGPYRTVRNFTKKALGKRRSLQQPAKLLDGKEDPGVKVRLSQDGDHGKIIAWTAVFAPPVATEVKFTIVHSGEYGKGAQVGCPVEEFESCTYTFGPECTNTFDIDIEALATKETSLLKRRPCGLSILARAQKAESGEVLGDSSPVAIQGPGTKSAAATPPCLTPSPQHAFAFNTTVFTTPDDPTGTLTPSSHEHRVAIKPTPLNRMEYVPARPTLGYGIIPKNNPATPGPCVTLQPDLRGQSPGSLLATAIGERLMLDQSAPHLFAQSPYFQDMFQVGESSEDGRQNCTVHSTPWRSPVLTHRPAAMPPCQPLALSSSRIHPADPELVLSNQCQLAEVPMKKRPSSSDLRNDLSSDEYKESKIRRPSKILGEDKGGKEFGMRGYESDEDLFLVPSAMKDNGPAPDFIASTDFLLPQDGDENAVSTLNPHPDLYIKHGLNTGVEMVRTPSGQLISELEAASVAEEVQEQLKEVQEQLKIGLLAAPMPRALGN